MDTDLPLDLRRVLLAGLLALVALSSAHAQVSVPSSVEGDRVIGAMMSPYCPGKTLATCTSPAARELRREIVVRLESGEAPDALVESLVSRFGERVRAVPKAAGFGLALWVSPYVAAGAVGVVLWLSATRRRRLDTSSDDREGTEAVDPSVIRRLENELLDLA